MTKRKLILSLYEIGAVRFGSFTLKSGIQSPVYVDLRRSVSVPKILIAIAEALYEKASSLSFDLICGVPYTAIPFTTAISIRHNLPMALLRKEKKAHGTGQLLEGVYSAGQRCLLFEDVVTSGSSLLSTIEAVRQQGLVVEEAVALVDRCQGGIKALLNQGVHTYSVLTLPEIADVLEEESKIEAALAADVKTFLREHQTC